MAHERAVSCAFEIREVAGRPRHVVRVLSHTSFHQWSSANTLSSLSEGTEEEPAASASENSVQRLRRLCSEARSPQAAERAAAAPAEAAPAGAERGGPAAAAAGALRRRAAGSPGGR